MPTPLDRIISRVPDFHPEDQTPLPAGPPPIRDGRLFVPPHWGKLWGLDFGVGRGHPFGAVLCAWDREADVFYVLKTVKMEGAIPEAHIAAMRRIDGYAPVAWPHDGCAKEKSTNETIAEGYRKAGLTTLLPTFATFQDGGYSTEAAVFEMNQRMQTGRMRVCEDLHDWWFEYRLYHREKGLIVKADEDLLSATMKAIMMKRYARSGPLGFVPMVPKTLITDPRQVQWDVFTGRPL